MSVQWHPLELYLMMPAYNITPIGRQHVQAIETHPPTGRILNVVGRHAGGPVAAFPCNTSFIISKLDATDSKPYKIKLFSKSISIPGCKTNDPDEHRILANIVIAHVNEATGENICITSETIYMMNFAARPIRKDVKIDCIKLAIALGNIPVGEENHIKYVDMRPTEQPCQVHKLVTANLNDSDHITNTTIHNTGTIIVKGVKTEAAARDAVRLIQDFINVPNSSSVFTPVSVGRLQTTYIYPS